MRRSLPLLHLVLCLCLLLLVSVVALLGLGRVDRVVTASGELGGGSAPVFSPRAGRIEQVDVTAGHEVEPGLEVKIRLDGYPWLLHGTLAGEVAQVAERRELGINSNLNLSMIGAAQVSLTDTMSMGASRLPVPPSVGFTSCSITSPRSARRYMRSDRRESMVRFTSTVSA
jgi:hypothetical protein